MGEHLGLSVGEDQGQFVREPLAIMQNLCAVLFLFFPMISELHGAPVSDVAIFSLTEHTVEHSCRAQ